MGRPKGQSKSGGSQTGSVKTLTVSVKEAVLSMFNEVNGDNNQYLRDMAENDPKLFTALFSKMIPAAIEATVTHTIDLGSALIDAQARLNAMQSDPNTIEHNPPAVEASSMGSMSPASTVEPLAVVSDDPAAPPPNSRPYLLDEQFDVALDQYGQPISGDD